jgi:hypothetical protein
MELHDWLLERIPTLHMPCQSLRWVLVNYFMRGQWLGLKNYLIILDGVLR